MHMQILVTETETWTRKATSKINETCQNLPLLSVYRNRNRVLKLPTLWNTEGISIQFDVWIIWFKFDKMYFGNILSFKKPHCFDIIS